MIVVALERKSKQNRQNQGHMQKLEIAVSEQFLLQAYEDEDPRNKIEGEASSSRLRAAGYSVEHIAFGIVTASNHEPECSTTTGAPFSPPPSHNPHRRGISGIAFEIITPPASTRRSFAA